MRCDDERVSYGLGHALDTCNALQECKRISSSVHRRYDKLGYVMILRRSVALGLRD